MADKCAGERGGAAHADHAPSQCADSLREKNRMQGLLANHGLRLPKGRDLNALLEEMRLWDGSPLPAGVRARLPRRVSLSRSRLELICVR